MLWQRFDSFIVLCSHNIQEIVVKPLFHINGTQTIIEPITFFKKNYHIFTGLVFFQLIF
jgi:hypothetical protein